MKAPLQVLVVEDVDSMRLYLEQLLGELEGVQVSGLARDTWEARLEIDRRRPHLVLLDEILPGESSYDFIPELVARQIPIYLMTSLEEATHALPAGPLGRIQKPDWKTHASDLKRFEKLLREFALTILS